MKMDGARYELEKRADVVRARLLGTIDELDRRRQDIMNVKLQLRRHASDLLSGFGGILLGIGATAAIVAFRQRRHDRRIRQERLRAVVRLWKHPERIAERHGFIGAALRMSLVALAAIATTTLGVRQIDRLRRRPRVPAHPNEALGV